MAEQETTRAAQVELSLKNLDAKTNQLLFFIPDNPSGILGVSVYEIYRHATALKQAGYTVRILTESAEYEIPDWFESELTDVEHQPLLNNQLPIRPEDVLIIPDSATWLMEQIKEKRLPCLKVVLAQTYDIALNALLPGMSWKDLGMDYTIVTSEKMRDFFSPLFQGIPMQVCRPAIPVYFQPSALPKQPVINLLGRNVNDLHNKVTKLFYLKYPHFRWISFRSLGGLPRTEFATKLAESPFAVWVDRIAGFGTFPLECMATDTICLGLLPDVIPSYVNDKNGDWSADIYQLADRIALYLMAFLEDQLPSEKLTEGQRTVADYRPELANADVRNVYATLLAERRSRIEAEAQLINEISAK